MSVRSWPNEKSLLSEVKDRVISRSLSLVAAGVAFSAFLSVFPVFAIVVSRYELIADAQTVLKDVSSLGGILTPDVKDILAGRLQDSANDHEGSLTMG